MHKKLARGEVIQRSKKLHQIEGFITDMNWKKLQYEKNPKTGNWYYDGDEILDSSGKVIGKKPHMGGTDVDIWKIANATTVVAMLPNGSLFSILTLNEIRLEGVTSYLNCRETGETNDEE